MKQLVLETVVAVPLVVIIWSGLQPISDGSIHRKSADCDPWLGRHRCDAARGGADVHSGLAHQ
jgi:hypothetical protein